MRKLALLMVLCCASDASAQLLLYEGFDYTAASPVLGQANSSSGTSWLLAADAAFTETPAIAVAAGSLTAPATLNAPAGNSASLTGIGTHSGAADRLAFAPTAAAVTSGTVYYSLSLRIDSLTGSTNGVGGFFLAFNSTGNSASTTNPMVAAARLQSRIDPTDGTKYDLGIFQRNATAGATTWSSTPLDVGTTHFIVASYEVNATSGSGGLNVSRLWIDPNPATFGGVEPVATVSDTGGGSSDFAPASILLRQSPAPQLTLDELRVGKSWASVTSSGAPVTLDANFDDDTDVDGVDFGIWNTGFGTAAGGTNATGDANGDGDVDGSDFLVWQQQFGTGLPSAAASQAIPEPGALVLAACGVAAIGGLSSRRRS